MADAMQPRVGYNTLKSVVHGERPSLQGDSTIPNDGETACVLGL